MKDFVMYFVLTIQAISVVGVLFLVGLVACWIYKEIRKGDEKEKCKWKDEKSESIFKTECGKQFFDASETGSPPTDWMTHCPYCGKHIED